MLPGPRGERGAPPALGSQGTHRLSLGERGKPLEHVQGDNRVTPLPPPRHADRLTGPSGSGQAQACMSPLALKNLADGNYTLSVVATDIVSPRLQCMRVWLGGPDQPRAFEGGGSARRGSSPRILFACACPCTHGVPVSTRSRPLQVGNVGAATEISFMVDTTPPRFTTLSYPNGTSSNGFTVRFVASDGNGCADERGTGGREAGCLGGAVFWRASRF